MPTYSSEQLEQIVQHRLERLRDTWKQEHEDLLAEIGALQDQVDELEAELAQHRNRDIGTGTPLRADS